MKTFKNKATAYNGKNDNNGEEFGGRFLLKEALWYHQY
jgi:hypothetical protein